jgi:hypothetical protein
MGTSPTLGVSNRKGESGRKFRADPQQQGDPSDHRGQRARGVEPVVVEVPDIAPMRQGGCI